MLKHSSRLKKVRVWGIFAALLVSPSIAQSKPLEGVGELKFGMTPKTVQSLSGCSTSDECLYELLGKNRYFTLSYRSPLDSDAPIHSEPTSQNRTLRSIDVDMGYYTGEWFLELFEVLQSQYELVHSPTELEDALFQQQKHAELIIGFADGHVLLKIIRRPFGNLILHVVFQDATSATQTLQKWALSSIPSNPPSPSSE